MNKKSTILIDFIFSLLGLNTYTITLLLSFYLLDDVTNFITWYRLIYINIFDKLYTIVNSQKKEMICKSANKTESIVRRVTLSATNKAYCPTLHKMVQAHAIRSKSRAELTKQLGDLKQELSSLKVQKLSNQNQNKLVKIGSVRKDIARVLTVMSQTKRQQLAIFYAGKKYIPTDLRAKKTRAIRRQMTKFESSSKTLKQQKKDIHFPQRK